MAALPEFAAKARRPAPGGMGLFLRCNGRIPYAGAPHAGRPRNDPPSGPRAATLSPAGDIVTIVESPSIALEPAPAWPRLARRAVASASRGLAREVIEVAEPLTSEVVTNALL